MSLKFPAFPSPVVDVKEQPTAQEARRTSLSPVTETISSPEVLHPSLHWNMETTHEHEGHPVFSTDVRELLASPATYQRLACRMESSLNREELYPQRHITKGSSNKDQPSK